MRLTMLLPLDDITRNLLLGGCFSERIDSGRAVQAGELLNFNVFYRFLSPATGIARLPPLKNRRVLWGSLNLLSTCSQVPGHPQKG
jgi:hypothetical protein